MMLYFPYIQSLKANEGSYCSASVDFQAPDCPHAISVTCLESILMLLCWSFEFEGYFVRTKLYFKINLYPFNGWVDNQILRWF